MRLILKIQDRYFEWSTIADAPITDGMALEEFRDYYIKRYGTDSTEYLNRRLRNVEKFGSCIRRKVVDIIAGNRAGMDDEELSEQEIYDEYHEENI